MNFLLRIGTDITILFQCGADYVKIQQVPPKNIPLIPFLRSVSIDGDADRVVYYYTDKQDKFHLLDGDRIATLFAAYLKELVSKSQLNLQLGLVQTAYANGGSTAYISESLVRLLFILLLFTVKTLQKIFQMQRNF